MVFNEDLFSRHIVSARYEVIDRLRIVQMFVLFNLRINQP